MNKDSSKGNKIFNKNNFINWIIGGFIALIIGEIMEPLFSSMFSFFLNIGGSFITYIADSTYREISNGYSEQSASSAFYLICICILCYLGTIFVDGVMSYRALKNTKHQITNSTPKLKNKSVILSEFSSQNLEKENKILKFSYLYNIIAFAFLFITLMLFYGRNSFIRNKTIALINNIEIVSPYISDIEYKQLKSKFHSIQTQSDYYSLTEDLKAIANEYSLELK